MANCWGCRFALMARGDKVRCLKAEELFGGERWVIVLEQARCGCYEPFVGDDSRVPYKPKRRKRKRKTCPVCNGNKKLSVVFLDKTITMKCYQCKGNGKISEKEMEE
jgi:hypothetical protein